MNEGAVAAIAEIVTVSTGHSSVMQPTAAQIAQFRTQLERPLAATELAYYAAPTAAAPPGRFQGALDYASRVSESLQTQFERPNPSVTADLKPEVQAVMDSMDMALDMQRQTVQFQCIAKALELSNNGVKTLYSQSG